MSSLGRVGRARRAAAAFVAAGSLFALQALVATPALAVNSCIITGSTLAVNMPDGVPASAVVGADANNQIFVSFDGAAFTNCGGVLTIATTTQITISGAGADQYAEIAQYRIDETAAPAAVIPDSLPGPHAVADGSNAVSWGSVKFTASLGTSASDNDVLSLNNFFSPTASNVTIGAGGIDLTTDGTADMTYAATEQIQVLGSNSGTVFDFISGQGDTATGAVTTTRLNVNGYDGDDTVGGGSGNDQMRGGAGDDGVSGGLGDDTLDGDTPGAVDAGTADTVDYSGSATAVTVNLNAGVATGEGLDTLVGVAGNNSFERIVGSDQNDVLTGDDSGNRITPGLGDDTVAGGAPGSPTVDFLAGGTPVVTGDTVNYSNIAEAAGVQINLQTNLVEGAAGKDTLTGIEHARGSQGDDTITDRAESNNYMRGQAGKDTFDQGGDPGGFVAETDVIDGEADVDKVNYSARTLALDVILNTGSTAAGTVRYLCNGVTTPFPASVGVPAGFASGDAFDLETDMVTDVENADLGSGGDTFSGSDFNNVVTELGGQNLLNGCNGIDTVNYSGVEDGGVTVNLAGGGPVGTGDSATNFENATGSPGNDNIIGSDGANQLRGGKGNDKLSGNDAPDTIIGGAGDDRIRGGDADDTLQGKGGNDNIRGGDGDDDLNGGKGKHDVCDGGGGSDHFSKCETKIKKPVTAAAREAKLATLR
jgi:Ca2+-binding RTX toxin-like protein